MTTYQQTTPPLAQTRATEPDEQAEDAVTVQNAVRSRPGDPAVGQLASKDNPITTTTQPERAHRSFTYPAWPTSEPGPWATSPLPGQHPHPRRTDQMVYEYYDQERGMLCVPPPGLPPMREQRNRTYRPDTDFQEVVSEEEALQRWLDDGGRSDHETLSDREGVFPLLLASS